MRRTRRTQHRIPLAQFPPLAIDLHGGPALEGHVHLVRPGVGVRRLRLSRTQAIDVQEEALGGEEVVLLQLRLGEAAGVGEVLDLHGAFI